MSELLDESTQQHINYQLPDPDILNLADVDLPPVTVVDDDGKWAMILYRRQYKAIEELAEREMRLGGMRIDPIRNISSRKAYYYNISVYDIPGKKEFVVDGLPGDLKLANLSWSPDQSLAAFTNTVRHGVELWVLDIGNRSAFKVHPGPLNANLGRPYIWDRHSQGFLIKALPKQRAELINKDEVVPGGPIVSENTAGEKAPNRTYQDLLRDKDDEYNFEILATSELLHVDLRGHSRKWLNPGMYKGLIYSPDGEYVLLSKMHRPFSYIVPLSRFPFTVDLYQSDGTFVRRILKAPLEENRPKGFMSTRAGIREVQWRDDKAASLVYYQTLDDGDAEKEVEYRDEVYQWDAPFKDEPKLIFKSRDRMHTILWGGEDLAIAYDYWWNTRTVRSYLFNPANSEAAPRIFHERNFQDSYNDPGNFVVKRNEFGRFELERNDSVLYLTGQGHSPEGILPFFDEFDVDTLRSRRIWRAAKSNQLESIFDVIDAKKGIILERIQSSSQYPNYFIRNIHSDDPPEQITFYKNPFIDLQQVHKEVLRYKRSDGTDLSAVLYLPPDYDQETDGRLPLLMWAYPEEFKDRDSAGQVTTSPNEFSYPWYGSPIFWVMRGYAVLDDVSFPIIGLDDDEPNDTFIEQLVSSAKAAIDAMDDLGYIDRKRVAIGGHSYGAFMTANLLSHSDLFAAGIARSGAYNRTLTPFGFQSEERNYWEAPDVYHQMSPFSHADKMKTPLLLIHGEEDNNSGTYPMQSERYFNALKGLGAPVRLVLLPRESHSYQARESILHMLWEQDKWLEKWVSSVEDSRPTE